MGRSESGIRGPGPHIVDIAAGDLKGGQGDDDESVVPDGPGDGMGGLGGSM